MSQFVIAVDGHAASGKGTASKLLAKELNFEYVGAGTIFRSVAWAQINANISDIEKLYADRILRHVWLKDQGREAVVYNQVDIVPQLGTEEIGRAASHLAAMQFATLAEMVRNACKSKKYVIVDGRNVGTDIFPDAQLKLFVSASPEVRAMRRFNELKKNDPNLNYERVLTMLIQRDRADENRVVNPFRVAHEAFHLDTSELSPAEVVSHLSKVYNERFKFTDENSQVIH